MRKKWLTVGTALGRYLQMSDGTENKDEAASTQETAGEEKDAESTPEETEGGSFAGMISPVSREEGSGTRGAFIELFRD